MSGNLNTQQNMRRCQVWLDASLFCFCHCLNVDWTLLDTKIQQIAFQFDQRINPLIKIYTNYSQKPDFETLPWHSNKTLMIKQKIKLVRCDPNRKQEKHPWGCHVIFIDRGLNPLFHHPVLLLILNSIKIRLCPTKKKRQCHTNSLIFDLWEF